MQRVMKWRYYCDFCGKSGCSGGHIKKHEKHCTANPDRECGLCGLAGRSPKPMKKLITAIGVGDEKGMKAVRKASGDCPACILAAMRQADLLNDYVVPLACSSFDYQQEKKVFFNKHTPQGI